MRPEARSTSLMSDTGKEFMDERMPEEMRREERVLPPLHPGGILEMEFLEPLEMTPYALAKEFKVPAPRVHDIMAGKRESARTPFSGCRVASSAIPRGSGKPPSHYDLRVAEEESAGRTKREMVAPLVGGE